MKKNIETENDKVINVNFENTKKSKRGIAWFVATTILLTSTTACVGFTLKRRDKKYAEIFNNTSIGTVIDNFESDNYIDDILEDEKSGYSIEELEKIEKLLDVSSTVEKLNLDRFNLKEVKDVQYEKVTKYEELDGLAKDLKSLAELGNIKKTPKLDDEGIEQYQMIMKVKSYKDFADNQLEQEYDTLIKYALMAVKSKTAATLGLDMDTKEILTQIKVPSNENWGNMDCSNESLVINAEDKDKTPIAIVVKKDSSIGKLISNIRNLQEAKSAKEKSPNKRREYFENTLSSIKEVTVDSFTYKISDSRVIKLKSNLKSNAQGKKLENINDYPSVKRLANS